MNIYFFDSSKFYLEGYSLSKVIGSGMSSVVLECLHANSGSKVAIKVISKTFVDVESRLNRLFREINIMKSIYHPLIIQLYQVIEVKDFFYLISEFAVNGSLGEKLEKFGSFTEQNVRKYFTQIFCVLEYLHQTAHIAHRDIKAENILIDSFNNIKVIDFGFSSSFSQENPTFDSTCGSLCMFFLPEILVLFVLTPDYFPPEIIKGLPYSNAADIWSFGVLMYYLCVGQLPFQGSDFQQTLQKILFAQPSFPSSVPIMLRDLISRMLTKSQDQRITLQGIKEHQWFSPRDYNSLLQAISRSAPDFSFSPTIASQMMNLGIDISTLKPKLFHRELDHITTTYRIRWRSEILNELSESLNHSRTRSDTLQCSSQNPCDLEEESNEPPEPAIYQAKKTRSIRAFSSKCYPVQLSDL